MKLKVISRRYRYLLVITACTVLATVIQLLVPALALAHASLVRVEPAPNSVLDQPPERITCWFAEAVEPKYSDIKVLDSRGTQVDNRDSQVYPQDATSMVVTLPSLPNGIYTVIWSTVSAIDGHSLRGSFIFSIGEPLPSVPSVNPIQQSWFPPVEASFLKWLVLLSILAATGGLTFEFLIWRPVLEGSRSKEPVRQLRRWLSSRTSQLTWWFLGIFLLASIGQLLEQTAAAANLSVFKAFGSPMVSIASGTDWGRWWLWRVLLVVGTAVFLRVLSVWRNGSNGHLRYRVAFILPILSCWGILLTLSLVSHAAGVTQGRIAAIVTDYLHLLAAAFWVGGLFHLILALPAIRKSFLPEDERSTLAALVPRFSSMAILSVGMLIATGVYSSLFVVNTAQAWISPYGLTLLIKIFLVLILLWFGGLNLLAVRPLLEKNIAGVTWLNRLVRGEAVVAVILLLMVGMLTNMQPPQLQSISHQHGTPANSPQLDSTFDGVHVTIRVDPDKFGPNTVSVTLSQDASGTPITNASVVNLKFDYLPKDVGENTVYAQQTSPGNYLAKNVNFNLAGAWLGQLLVTRPDAFDLNVTFQFTLAGN